MPISFDGKSGEFSECIAHFMGKENKRTGKNFTKEDASKVCGSLQAKQEKENKFCGFGKIQLKEDEKDYHVSGFVATSHPDRASNDQFEGDIIPKPTLASIAEQINNRFKPEAGAVSYRHDWIRENDPNLPIAGVSSSPAVLKQTEDGQWGVFVDTVVSKAHPNYENIKTEVEQGIIPGFSIEYVAKDFIPTEKEGKKYRVLTDVEMLGYGFANRRLIANPHAEIVDYGYKELVSTHYLNNQEKIESKMEHEEHISEEDESSEETKKKKKKGEKMEEEKSAQEKEIKEETPKVEEISVSKEELTEFRLFKEQKEKAVKIKEVADLVQKQVKERMDAEIKELRQRTMPGLNTNPDGSRPEIKELKDYQDALAQVKELDKPLQNTSLGAYEQRFSLHNQIVNLQYKEAARLMGKFHQMGALYMGSGYASGREPIVEAKDTMIGEEGQRIFLNPLGRMEYKEKIEMKALDTASNAGTQTDTNLAHASWTYGSYYQSPVEFNDIFQPVIVNQLNDRNTTWGTLQKEDWSGYYQIAIRARTARNSTAAGYSEGTNYTYGTDFSGQVGYDKFVQPFSYYGVRVAVTGQKMALARAPGGIGDVWAQEVKWSTEDLLRVLDLAVIGTGAGSSESTSLGFEGLILGTTGTLYGKSLATYATLRSHTKAQASARVDLNELRFMVERVQTGTGSGSSEVISNANPANLIYFCHPLQERFVKGLIQDMQRIIPTSARVGFEGRVDIDGVPIVTDFRMNTDDIFLIDTSHTKVGVNLPPTVMPLPVTADAQAALIKIYWNLYSDQPGNNFWSSGFATT